MGILNRRSIMSPGNKSSNTLQYQDSYIFLYRARAMSRFLSK